MITFINVYLMAICGYWVITLMDVTCVLDEFRQVDSSKVMKFLILIFLQTCYFAIVASVEFNLTNEVMLVVEF